jgi:hypothetical protein
MKKVYELQNINDFISDFNSLGLGNLKLISGEEQENPDAIVLLNGTKKIGLEATIAIAPADLPNAKPKTNHPSEVFYNPLPVIDELMKLIKKKSLNDYKGEGIDETWLLISGGSFISIEDLKVKLKDLNIKTKFKRIFLHKGLRVKLTEITSL